jgi:NADH dehydrogenase
MMILLVGATGRLGKAVAERLLEDGIPFRAGCRTVTKAGWLAEQGVEVVPLDVARRAGLTEALCGVSKVISCIHGLLGRSRHSIERIDVRGQGALIDAAVDAGIDRFVYISALGASPDHPSQFWRAKARAEEHLRASGLNFVVLRPSAFMDLYAHDLIGAPVMRGKTAFLLGDGRTPRNMIAVSDVADAAVKALLRDDLIGQTIEVGGWDNPTEREIAALYASQSGRPLKVRTVPPAVLKALAAAVSPFHAGLGHLLRLPLQLAGRDDLLLDASSMVERFGIGPVRLRDFAQGKASAGEVARGS